jgi:hypothetical protein
MRRFVIVTAGDDNYIGLLEGLIRSIRDKPQGSDVPVVVFDLGLSPESKTLLAGLEARCVAPDWHYTFDKIYPEFYKAIVARPHLPKYAGEGRTIVWLDADTWVQDWAAIELLLQGADESGFAIAPEVDRSYSPIYNGLPYLNHQYHWYSTCFNEEIARNLCVYPLLNCGVLAGRADAPHWGIWAERLGDSLKRAILFVSEQTALNVTLRLDGLPVSLMPASCNWICFRSPPMCSVDGAVLLDPNPPHAPLGIVHLAGYDHAEKNKPFDLRTPQGGTATRSLIYRG